VVLGLVVSQIGIIIDRNLASRTGEQSIAWMRYATTLVQFPLGLVSAAIAMAILPTLSRLAVPDPAARDAFMDTLARGLKMVWVLILPAVVGLLTLAEPVVALVFQHGDFTPFDTGQTALALRLYLLGTAFAALDLPLVFAFYARQNTITPALVGMAGVGLYLIAALIPTAFRPLRMSDLVLANSVQLTGHALIMLWLAHRFGSLRGRGLGQTGLRALLAALLMACAISLGRWSLANLLPVEGTLSWLLLVGLAGGLGLIAYVAALVWLRVEEVGALFTLAQRLVGRLPPERGQPGVD